MTKPIPQLPNVCKRILLLSICIFFITNIFAQVGISTTSITPNSSSILELRSSTLGFLPPRMTTTERDAIASPANGLVIYNTTTSLLNFYNGTSWQITGGGSVSSVSVTTANGISGTVTNASTTPAISLTLGAITPTSVTATGTVTGSNLSGTNTGDQTTITGNAGSATLTAITDDNTTAATMYPTWVTTTSGNQAQKVSSTKLSFNPSTGTLTATAFSGSLTGNASTVTTNANLTGEVTSVGNTTTVTNASVLGKVLTGYVSGAGTITATDNILQAIQKLNGNNATNANLTGPITSVGNATSVASQTGTGSTFVMNSSPTLVTPNLGTPSTLVGTNITGTAAGLTAGNVTTNANLTGEVTSVGNTTTVTNASVLGKVLTGYVSGAGTITATDNILQAIQKLDGNNATNANLTGPITSVGNATSVASQTGTGSTFVMNTSPTLVTPNLGTPSTLIGTNITGTAAGLTAGNVTTNANLTGDVTSVGNATTIGSGKVTNSMLAGSIDLTTKVTNTLPVTNGGTGQSTALVQGGIMYGASTTSEGVTTAGTAGQYLQSGGTGAPTWVSGTTIVTLGSDVINNNATANTIADVTGLSFSVTAGVTYRFKALIIYTSAATTTGSRWSINGPASPTIIAYTSHYPNSSIAETVNYANAYDLPAASNTVSPFTSANIAQIEGIIKPSANGTVVVRFASEVSNSAITAKAGSTLTWW